MQLAISQFLAGLGATVQQQVGQCIDNLKSDFLPFVQQAGQEAESALLGLATGKVSPAQLGLLLNETKRRLDDQVQISQTTDKLHAEEASRNFAQVLIEELLSKL